MNKAWEEFQKAVGDGATLILNPSTYEEMMAAAEDEEHRNFLRNHSRVSRHIPTDQALAVFTRQETIDIPKEPA